MKRQLVALLIAVCGLLIAAISASGSDWRGGILGVVILLGGLVLWVAEDSR